MAPKRCAKCSSEQWVAVIVADDDVTYCVLGPYVLEDTAKTVGAAYVAFMEAESVGGCTFEVRPLVSFDDARDMERRANAEIAGEDVEDNIDTQIHQDLENGHI